MTNLQSGQLLGAYRIVSQIGQGGMATVYKAYHAAMDRYVAIKVLPKQFMESPEFIGRFQQEARVIANLEHPHILPIYDYGEHENIPYFIMRYFDGGTLKERIQAGLSLVQVDRFFTQLAEAIGYAHEKGVLHRDIKPSNALVDSRGDLFLTDFGIAKLLEGTSQFTATGALTGTPAYMSPEQAQGQKVDQRTDVYSLGIVLYEMVTGHVPFQAETPWAVVIKQIQAPLPLPSSLKPDLPLPIERVILKALAKEPEDRFADMPQFLAAWKQAYEESQRGIATLRPPEAKTAEPLDSPTLPRPPQAEKQTIVKPSVAPTGRKLPLGWIAGGVALLAVLVLAVIFWPDSPPDEPGTSAQNTPIAEVATAVPLNLPSGWTSWTGGNLVYHVVVSGENVYAGGPGGVTIWNRADDTVLRRYTTADGLPDYRITALFVDTDDSLWVGTINGLAHLEGEEWVVYGEEDGLDSGDIHAIVRAGDRLIVGTYYSYLEGGGLNQFDGRSWSAVSDFPSADPGEQPDKLSFMVNTILAGENGRLAVGTENGLGLFDGSSWTRYSTADGLPSDRIFNLLNSENGLLVGTETQLATFRDGNFEITPQGPEYGVYGMVQAANGRYWFASSSGLWEFNPNNGNWETHNQNNGDFLAYNIYGGTQDDAGNLYFGSDDGLIRYDGNQFTTWRIPNIPVSGSFSGIVATPDNKLWFLEDSGSTVSQLDPATQTWSLYQPPCSCFLFHFDAAGNLWGNEWMNGFWVVAPDGTATNYTEGIPAETHVWNLIVATDGTPWLGTNRGLIQLEGTQVAEIFTSENSTLNDDMVRVLLSASDGSLWVGTDRGLSRRLPDGQWETFTVGNPFVQELPYVLDLTEGENGEIWVGTPGQGAYRWQDGTWKQFYPGDAGVQLPSADVYAITIAPDGIIWFATDAGATKFDGTTWQTFKTADGLINDFVFDIYVHPSGIVWFATQGGVSQFVP